MARGQVSQQTFINTNNRVTIAKLDAEGSTTAAADQSNWEVVSYSAEQRVRLPPSLPTGAPGTAGGRNSIPASHTWQLRTLTT